MNLVEWLVYAAAWKHWCRARAITTEEERNACAWIIGIAHRD